MITNAAVVNNENGGTQSSRPGIIIVEEFA